MRKLLIGVISSLAIAAPIAIASPSIANAAPKGDTQVVTYYEGMIAAWKHFANFENKKALNILNYVRKNPKLTSAELEMLDLMRLTIYRQAGNLYVYSTKREAIEYLTEAIALDDSNVHVRHRRGQAYCETGNFDYCKRDFAAAWKLTKDKSSEKLADHLSRRGKAYFRAGNKKEGIADLREAIRLYKLSGKDSLASVYEGLLREYLSQK